VRRILVLNGTALSFAGSRVSGASGAADFAIRAIFSGVGLSCLFRKT